MDDPALMPLQVRDRLARMGRVDPGGLARLFSLSSLEGELPARLLDALQAALAHRTVAHARANVPWYRDHPEYARWALPEGALGPAIELMSGLPVLDRAVVAATPARFVAEDVTLGALGHTSGSTGTPLQVRRSVEEAEFTSAYFASLSEPLARGHRRPISLNLPNAYHGTPLRLPAPGLSLSSGVTDDLLLAETARALTARYDLPGYGTHVEYLSGLVNHVLLLTGHLMEQGTDPRSLGLRGVSVAGGAAAPHWRHFLHRAWGCRVTDRFSLTEVLGGASRCPGCDLFHLDPHVYGEVLEPGSDAPVTEGPGRLVLTAFHPFVQMQPMIRYDAGDLVMRSKNGCGPTPAFEFLGKHGRAVTLEHQGRRRWLLFPAELNAVLAELPDVRAVEWASHVRSVRDRTLGGLPYARARLDASCRPPELRVEVELRYGPHFHPERAEEVGSRVAARLRGSAGTALAELEAEGAVRLRVVCVPPGSLPEPALKL
ncbi:phenylacetate--CoA ligase family protein [Nocardiopsis suaedae]|uniref:Phenylacetate--CoA ligase family protein n=1 Tax=Nocardiopsis suaedae TaxID=3018444 RepID=A0ABT4TG08_9ACTN|nr:phenylacetate--CoA ligase family protein [Nocardiopsis suaedae]MDA2803649.1 phenylacetate--CoA ligase family protein [Nocardiopsis suaedae]